ncbi:MAG: hypothetical protein H0X73_13650 [Chthoniobacterales bacterium]|nr:hypothetical protein [Chthoniobacterales bacterium]
MSGITLAGTLTKRLLIGWIVALISSVAGLYFSFYGDESHGRGSEARAR